jgi:hypothetical protein
VDVDGVAAGNDHARGHLFQALKPGTFASPHRLDAIDDRDINVRPIRKAQTSAASSFSFVRVK